MKTPSKTPIIVSVVLTVILLILVGIVSMFGQVIALNGVINDRQATTALGIGRQWNCGLTRRRHTVFAEQVR